MNNIFDNLIKIELSEAEAQHLYELLKNEVVNCRDFRTMRVYMPTLDKLRTQISKQQISSNYLY